MNNYRLLAVLLIADLAGYIGFLRATVCAYPKYGLLGVLFLLLGLMGLVITITGLGDDSEQP